MKKSWHYREFRNLSLAVQFANERNLSPGEILIGPQNNLGFIEVMYFADRA